MPDYTCDEVTNAFIAQSGLLSDRMYSRVSPKGIWVASTPRGEWKDGMGLVQNSLLWERTVPTDDGDEWASAALSDGNTDNCELTPELVEFGQTERTMQMQRRNIQTQEFCVEDLRADHQIQQVAKAIDKNLAWITDYVWDSRDRREYIRLAEHKVTEKATVDINATSFVAGTPPTSRLTWGTLEQIYNQLKLEDGGMSAVGRTSNNRPVYDLFTDGNTIRDLIRQDPDLREDFRFAFMGEGINSPLLSSLGVGITYNGWRLIEDRFPLRENIETGAYVSVAPYTDPEATTKGKKQLVNQDYLYATYQTSVVHIPSVFTQLVPKPISSIGSMKFNPVNYMGDFQFLNIKDKVCNPRGTKGFFDAVFASASEPGDTYLGYAIKHLNCAPYRHRRSCNDYS